MQMIDPDFLLTVELMRKVESVAHNHYCGGLIETTFERSYQASDVFLFKTRCNTNTFIVTFIQFAKHQTKSPHPKTQQCKRPSIKRPSRSDNG